MASKKDPSHLKQLWQEKKKEKGTKIMSPYAKYNSLGRLSCSLCNVPIKSETLWNAHVANKQHKQNVAAQASRQPAQKRPMHPPDNQDVAPKPKVTKMEEESPVAAQLPPGVSAMLSQIEAAEGEVEAAMDTVEAKPEDASKLPEGFFDDPKQDAQARGKEYKDPLEEAWEQFQKEMNMEAKVSEGIVDHEAEESEVTQTIHDIDEQIVEWGKFVELEKLWFSKDKVKQEPAEPPPEEPEDSDPSGESDSEDVTNLDWRAKGFIGSL